MRARIQKKIRHFSHELKCQMRSHGFIHITGLHWTNTVNGEEGFVQPKRETFCRWSHDKDEGKTIAILENGEVWLHHGDLDDHLLNFLRRICPRGKGAITTLPDIYIIGDKQLGDRNTNFYSSRYYEPTPHPF